ncbi:hypothetical protein SAMD00019534_072350 [Acytostelium subglobosum LB1]|uniref:hypothetical protein n=1 Tax=Acytostelium subglobosum LB1 TaxID=1410327 RepID=UPI000644B31D|nr:hypothetical protein SAMD00019534_072350 [Acytostelium subglobosum LB1]GAM24060.1 hypothetical protein SAMD00019534_072350 [Acytostelium subglobosum LB1]|eukprot:XP_012753096.1 hypothetical protein SAMD00019534_072350 [Acytostelium subglobosum LB1]
MLKRKISRSPSSSPPGGSSDLLSKAVAAKRKSKHQKDAKHASKSPKPTLEPTLSFKKPKKNKGGSSAEQSPKHQAQSSSSSSAVNGTNDAPIPTNRRPLHRNTLYHPVNSGLIQQQPQQPTKECDNIFANQSNEFIPLLSSSSISNNVQTEQQPQQPSTPQQQHREKHQDQMSIVPDRDGAAQRLSNQALQRQSGKRTPHDKQIANLTPPLWCQGFCRPQDLTVLELEQELDLFYKWLAPNRYENQLRQLIVNEIEAIVTKRWPKAKVIVFGSFSTDLCIPSSDIDIQVSGINDGQPAYSDPIREMHSILLKSYQNTFTNIRLIAGAKVPIIKFVHRESWYNVDICFDTPNGVENTGIVKMYLKKYKSMKLLLLLLKYFLFQNNLNETYTGGIGSYALALMVASFIQMRHIPYDQRVVTRKSKPIDEKDRRHAGEDTDYGAMLLEFFQLYGQSFQYSRHGICLTNGGFYFQKEEQFGTYLTLRDPHDANNDVGRNSFNISFIRGVFTNAFVRMVSNDLLKDKYANHQFPTVLSRIIEERLVEQQAKDRNNVLRLAKSLETANKLPAITSQSSLASSPILVGNGGYIDADTVTVSSISGNNGNNSSKDFVNINSSSSTSSDDFSSEESIHSGNESGSDVQSASFDSDYFCSSESGSESEEDSSTSSVSAQSTNLYGW